ncbi:MAG: OmpH family outer membrane protein [Bacteroidales bacterium]|nr:OmpH family outer membrane protein [Bacteroidales bacterium]
MKKILIIAFVSLCAGALFAQKYAYVDTEYILNNIPIYETAKTQLDDFTTEWKAEIDEMKSAIDKMYNDYQSERVLLTEELRVKREEEILEKEKEMRELQQKYFGKEGMLFKKREELIKPIQDDIYNAIKEIATEGSYAVIFDTANSLNMLYTDPRYDKSDDVLRKLGYKN